MAVVEPVLGCDADLLEQVIDEPGARMQQELPHDRHCDQRRCGRHEKGCAVEAASRSIGFDQQGEAQAQRDRSPGDQDEVDKGVGHRLAEHRVRPEFGVVLQADPVQGGGAELPIGQRHQKYGKDGYEQQKRRKKARGREK